MNTVRPTPLRHLPNALCVLRMLMAPPIAWMIVADHAELALVCFLVAAVSDVVDGWLAKRYGWQSQIGGWLDPLADKLLVLSTATALALHADLPWWLYGLIAVRDLVIVSGAVAYHFRYAPLHAEPTILGKLTTLTLVVLLVLLLYRNAHTGVPMAVADALILLSTALLLASGADYVRRWSAKARLLKRGPG